MKTRKIYILYGLLMALLYQGYANNLLADLKVEVRPISPEIREKEWQQELSSISDIEKTSFIFQVNLKNTPPRFTDEKGHGSATMKMLAVATNRQWTEIDGVQVFLPTSNASGLTVFSNWLQDLTPQQREGLMEGNFDFQMMPSTVQNTLLHLIGEWYPQIYQDILNGTDNIRLQVIFGPQLVFNTYGTIYDLQTREGDIEVKPILYNSKDAHSIPPAQISKIVISKPLNKTLSAKLDFGVGQILSLSKINAMAEQTYQKTFSLPQSADELLFFVSGQITEDAWLQTLQKITLAQMPAVKDEVNRTHSLKDTLLKNEWETKSEEVFDLAWMSQQKFNTGESAPISWFLTQRQMTLNELTKDRPGLARYLKKYHLQQDAPITLQATAALVINTPKSVFTLPLS